MQRPEIRIIQDQQVESTREITGSEAEQLLRKYGYADQSFSTRENPNQPPPQPALTFEEMVAQEEQKKRAEEERRRAQRNGPHPNTFDGRNGYDSEIKYGSDEETGYGFKIQIVSDMPIPKY
jgi:hypothetical protein